MFIPTRSIHIAGMLGKERYAFICCADFDSWIVQRV